jgi:hypothetical protein
MKPAWILFLTIGCVGLMQAAGHCAAPKSAIAPRGATTRHQPAPNKSAGVAKDKHLQAETGSNTPHARTSSVARPSVPAPLGNVRYRGPSPTAVGGPAEPVRGNTGVINGTQMRRKP